MNIAIITARGGSKRIPRKNIRPFLGKPMIAWPIEAAKESECFEHILVSTDDEEIAEIAVKYGAEVPFLRPVALADDFAHAHVAARHALEWAIENWGEIKAFCHLYPTAPMLKAQDIRRGLKEIAAGATNAYAMQKISFPVYQVLARNAAGELTPLFPEEKTSMRSQDMPPFYIDAGQMYWFETGYFLANETKVGTGTRAVELSPEAALDIDTEEDWLRAEKIAAREGCIDYRQPTL